MSFASNSCSNEAGTMFRIEPNLIKAIALVESMGFLCGSTGKESTGNAGDLSWEDPLEKGDRKSVV